MSGICPECQQLGAVIHSVVRYGLSVPCFGVGVDAALLARWAAMAETAGWDGFSSHQRLSTHTAFLAPNRKDT